MQFDADTVGSASVAADAEAAMLMADTLERVGISRGDYVVKINNRKVLDGVLEAIGLAGDENAGRRLTVLRAIDKLDKVGPQGVRDLLGQGRMDPSGDFTKGAGLDSAAIDRVLAFTAARRDDPAATVAALAEVVAGSPRGSEGVAELAEIATLVQAGGYGDGRIVLDPSVVRGLEYYPGPVYEAELTFEVAGDDGKPVRFGSVAGGGRYDGLVARFRGEPVPATGFSIGVSRLLAALNVLGKVDAQPARGPVVVLVMDPDRIADYQAMVAVLRAAGIRAELYLGEGKMKPQMRYADKRNSVCVVIQGSNERDAGEVLIKDLIVGAELAAASPDRKAYLREQGEAQFAVKVEDLVAGVQRVLAKHGVVTG
jgi:histidyl-tRNA synthetase